MNNVSNIGRLTGTIGAVGGIFYGMKKSSSFGGTAMYALLFGVVGVVVGQSISKFYQY